MPEITQEQLEPSVRDLYNKALAAVRVNNFEYAVKLLLPVVKSAPTFLEGRKILRQCESKVVGGPKKRQSFFGMKSGGGLGMMKISGLIKKDPLAAISHIEDELEKQPFNPELNESLFDAFCALGMVDSAAFALETVRQGHPEETKLMHKLAEFYSANSRGMDAAAVYRDILKHNPTDSVAIKGEKDATARASMAKARWSEDADISTLRKDVAEAEELEKASRTGLTREQLEERRDRLAAKYAEDQNNLDTVKGLANTYERLEDWGHAESFYRWAFNLSHGDVALQTKADEMRERGKEAQLAALEEEAKKNPDDPKIKAMLEERRKERIDEAVREAAKRVEHNPTDPVLRYEYGKALFDAGNFSDAIPQLQQARRNPHIQSKVLLLLGRTFKEKGMVDMGVKQLDLALEDLIPMDNTKKEILYEKGLMHDLIGENEQAIECFKQIYEDDYGYRDVAQRVESSYR